MMTSDYPELIADVPEPYSELIPDVPQRTAAAQSWTVTVAEAKYHWYDLVADFPRVPDIRDPVGRYLRRMQFDLEATMEKRLIYFVVTRPRICFDTSRSVSWGFFSLKLTIPVLVGIEQKRDSVSIELEVPFAATLKKPTVSVTERFITLNWGGLIEALSIHDVLQQPGNDVDFPSTVRYVGQTRDPSGRLAKARLAAVQKIHQAQSDDNDTLLLVQRLQVEVHSADGDPAQLPANQNAVAADALLKDRIDAVECALIRYFEGEEMRARSDKELNQRRERLREIAHSNQLQQFRIDLQMTGDSSYQELLSPHARRSRHHVIDCTLVDGVVQVSPVLDKARA
ncbi:MAG: hypothetical protein ACEQSK_05670 [Sphingomonadaceae bacterium]